MTKLKITETILRAVAALIAAGIAIIRFIGYADKAQQLKAQMA